MQVSLIFKLHCFFFFIGWLLSWPLEEAENSCAALGGSMNACKLQGWMITELTLWVVIIPIKYN